MAEFWYVETDMPFPLLAAFEEALGDIPAVAVSSHELAPTPNPDDAIWCLQALLDAPPDVKDWRNRFRYAGRIAGIKTHVFRSGYLPDQDWVRHTNILNAPVQAGRYYLFGAHDRGSVPPNALPLWLEAGLAFGTGRAPSTFGCLQAISDICRLRRPRRMLDFGCGSGVLAMAALRSGARAAVAADIDPVAVAVARDNAHRNGLAARMRCVTAHRPDDPQLAGKYDLVAANILAAPLSRMAKALSAQVAPGGYLVLSGLLAREDAAVRAHYLAQRMPLHRRIAREGWHTLVLQRNLPPRTES